MRRSAGVCALLVICLFAVCGCAAESTPVVEAEAQSEFDRLVSEADDAFAADEVKAALDLYTEALDLPDVNDPDGSITERRDYCKSLYVARYLLAKDQGEFEPRDWVTVIVDHSDATSETAEAKRRIIELIQVHADSMRDPLPDLRTTIAAEQTFRVPDPVYMVDAIMDHWMDSIGDLDGEFGGQAQSAMGLLAKAADEIYMIEGHKWVHECLADLDQAEATLAELDALLETMRSSL